MENKAGRGFGRKGWAVIIFTLFIYMFTCTIPDTLNVSVAVFAGAYGWDSNAMLIFSAIGGFVGIVISLIFGQIVAKKGVKTPTVILLIVIAVLWSVYGRANSLPMYGVSVVLATGIGNTLNLVSTQQIMSNWFPKKKGLALGWATMGTCFSSAIMVAVFQAMFNISIAAPFHLMTIIMAIIAVIMIVWFKAFPEEAGAYPDNEPLTEEEKAANLELINNYKSKFTAGVLFKTKEMWMLAIIFGFVALGLVAAVSQMIPRLMAVGMAQPVAILWLTIASIIGIPASVIWGIIDQKVGTIKTCRIFCILWTIMMLVSAAGSAMVSPLVSSISVVFYAVLLGGMMNLMPSCIIRVFGRYDFAEANKLVMPLVIGIRSCALILMPMLLAIAGANPNVGFRNSFVLCAILSLISTILAFALKDKCIGKE